MRKSVLLIVAISLSLPLLCQNVDIDLLKKINLERNTNLDRTFQYITDSAAIIAYGLLAIILLGAFIYKNTVHKRKAITIGASVLLSAIVASILKHTVNRSRPFDVYNFIQKVSDGGSPSIPSGHTTDAFAIATAICLAYPKWYIILSAFLWAFAVGYSRMDLGVHYPSDVLTGALIGSGVSLLCYKIDDRLKKAQK